MKKTKITSKTFSNSSIITKITYSENEEIMEVTFVNNQVYSYRGVPIQVWEAALSTESIGKFFHSEIKGKYTS